MIQTIFLILMLTILNGLWYRIYTHVAFQMLPLEA
jgi:hypothetical protein